MDFAPSRPAPIDIAGIRLDVIDLAGMAAFYCEAIGLELLAADAHRARLGVRGRILLELAQRPGLHPRAPAGAGLFHVAFLLPSRADLGRWLAYAAALRLRLDGAADHLVSEAVYLHDPEGNGIEIYADRPRAAWRWQGGEVAMANDRLDMIGLRALATTAWQGAPAGTTIGHVHLQVGEVAAAERFYVGQLGFDITRRAPQALFLSTGGYHHHLAVNTWNSAGAPPRTPGQTGLAELILHADPTRAAQPGDVQPGADPWRTPIRFVSNLENAFP